MTVESVTYISDLNATYPASGDVKSEGDNHIRNLKTGIKTTFPNVSGAVTPTHTELNYVDGVTSAIQTQITAKGAHAGQVWTGTQDFTGATITVLTQTAGDSSTKPASTTFVGSAIAAATLAAYSYTASTTATSLTVSPLEHVMVTASSQTMTLPLTPVAGVTTCRISTRTGITTTVGRNGKPIMGLAENMSMSGLQTATLLYHNATDGWVLI